MYAVFRAGGKQYRATTGERLKLEKFEGAEGDSVEFDEVLLVGEGNDIEIGKPLLSGTTVSAKVLRQGRTGKVSVTKFRRRHNYLRQHTHRQWFTEVEITAIGGKTGGKKPAEAATGDETDASAAKAASKKPSGKKVTTRKATAKSSGKKTTTTKKTSKKTVKKKMTGKDS
jgi:large subunit ribosomal protein L21